MHAIIAAVVAIVVIAGVYLFMRKRAAKSVPVSPGSGGGSVPPVKVE